MPEERRFVYLNKNSDDLVGLRDVSEFDLDEFDLARMVLFCYGSLTDFTYDVDRILDHKYNFKPFLTLEYIHSKQLLASKFDNNLEQIISIVAYPRIVHFMDIRDWCFYVRDDFYLSSSYNESGLCKVCSDCKNSIEFGQALKDASSPNRNPCEHSSYMFNVREKAIDIYNSVMETVSALTDAFDLYPDELRYYDCLFNFYTENHLFVYYRLPFKIYKKWFEKHGSLHWVD